MNAHPPTPETHLDSSVTLRRRFLKTASCLAAAVTVPSGVAHAASLRGAELTASNFRHLLQTEFRATALADTTATVQSLTLADVRAAKHVHPSLGPSQAAEWAFSLQFDAGSVGLTQDTYFVTHPRLGSFTALLVPTRNGASLRAEFHRLA